MTELEAVVEVMEEMDVLMLELVLFGNAALAAMGTGSLLCFSAGFAKLGPCFSSILAVNDLDAKGTGLRPSLATSDDDDSKARRFCCRCYSNKLAKSR